MSYQALARKWRPTTFAEVIGQEHVVTALGNALSSGRVHHAYLFTGTRGVGKTTLARIFARALNCEKGVGADPCGECAACAGISRGSYIDLIEVDAASRTRVDDTRELLENVQYAPTVGRFKIYLIDEVHMLSTHSFNALLKTLEEPPEHVKFLLATTDPQKLPATILSRCIQFNLKSMDIQMLRDHLERILDSESVASDSEALRILARSADGSVRDALSLTDQAIAHGDGAVHVESVRAMLGLIDDRYAYELLDAVCRRDGAAVLAVVARMAERSANFSAALDDVITSLHNAALYQVDPAALEWKGADPESAARIAGYADSELIQLLYQIALIGKRDMTLAPDGRTGFEMAMLRMTVFQPGSGESPDSTGSRSGDASLRGIRSNREAAGETRNSKDVDKRSVSQKSSGDLTEVETKPDQALGDGKASGPDSEATNVTLLRPSGDKSVSESADTESNEMSISDSESGARDSEIVDIWGRFVASDQLKGLSRELAMNMMPVGFNDGTLSLILDSAARHLFNDDRLGRLEKLFVEFSPVEVRLSAEIRGLDSGDAETPAMQRKRLLEERQAAAEKAFTEDPAVRGLIDRFDAEIVPESIRPPTK